MILVVVNWSIGYKLPIKKLIIQNWFGLIHEFLKKRKNILRKFVVKAYQYFDENRK